MLGAFIRDFVIDSSEPSAYTGRTFSLDGKKYCIGPLLAVGEEKFVYRLLDTSGKPVPKVFKIYRGQPDIHAEVAREMTSREIFQNIARDIKIPGGELRIPSHELHEVQGGLVALQQFLEGESWHALGEIKDDGIVVGPIFSDAEILPKHSELIPAEAFLLLKNHEFLPAHEILSKYFQKNDANVLCLELLVICCFYTGRGNEGFALLRAGIAANPSWERGRSLMSAMSGSESNVRELAQRLGYLLKIADFVSEKPATVPGTKRKYERANSLVQAALKDEKRGKYKQALKKYDAALAEDLPAWALGMVWYNKGNVFWAQGREKEAQDAYFRSLERPLPKEVFSGLLNNLSSVLANDVGRLHEALVCVEVAIENLPNEPFLWARRATVLYYLDRYLEAIAASQKTLELDPSSQTALEVHARAMRWTAKMEQLLNESIAKVKDNPRAVDGWRSIMVSLLNLGRVKDAMAVSDQALTHDRAWDQIHAMRAAAWLAQSNWDEAIKEADCALKITSDSSGAQYLKNAALRAQALEKKIRTQQGTQ